MSIPSTITATLPPPHNQHYGGPNHQPYAGSAGFYVANHSLFGGSRLAPAYNIFPFQSNTPTSATRNSTISSSSRQPQINTMNTPQSSTAAQLSKSRERRPDWHEFYKNGPPKEIIVIDDDSPPPPNRNENERVNHLSRTYTRGADSTEHASKKRRTGQALVSEPARYQPVLYATARGPADTKSDSISTDRTTSLQNTAPTSLESHASHGTSGAYAENGMVGQKRKRVTRQQTAEEKKRKEIEVVGDAYSSYVPPPKPPIKAKDVHVPPVKDVSAPEIRVGSKTASLHNGRTPHYTRKSTMTTVTI